MCQFQRTLRLRHPIRYTAALVVSLLWVPAFAHGEPDAHSVQGDSHAGSDHQGHAEHHHGPADPVSVMLIGACTFQMSLFYLVNWPDVDIQRYSWQVIGNTISIFCAVFSFTAVKGVVDAKIIAFYSEYELLIDFCQMLCWFTVMQLACGVLSGAIGDWTPDHFQEHDKLHQWREENLKCFAMMLAHMTGFASINFFATLQQVSYFSQSAARSALMLPLEFASLLMIFRITDFVRQQIASADGDIGEEEELWDEETEEAENDVIGLAFSFTAVHSLRYAVSGFLPNKEGEIAEERDNPLLECAIMVCISLFFGLITILLLVYLRRQDWHTDRTSNMRRYALIVQNIGMMCFVWSLLFASRDLLETSEWLPPGSVQEKVFLALSVSFGSFVVIFFLDKLADSDKTSNETDAAIMYIIASKGLLIGFTWESCFQRAVEHISESSTMAHFWFSPAVSKMFLSFTVCLVIVPAYRMYVLPTVHRHERLLELKMHAEREKETYQLVPDCAASENGDNGSYIMTGRTDASEDVSQC